MLDLKLRPFIETQDFLVQWSALFQPGGQWANTPAPKQRRMRLAQRLTRVSGQLEAHGFEMCSAGVNRLRDTMIRTDRAPDIASEIDDLRRRLMDQLERAYCLCLTSSERDLYAGGASKAATAIVGRLSDVSYDLDEAAKCLALGRSTAVVFHLMRVMEIGVQKFGDKLGVALVHEKNWQNILDQVNPQIKALGKAPEARRYAAIAAHLFHVKVAWRNEVMHPKATYTPDEATAVFAAVGTFMTDLVDVL
jgi:hypothetical protein